METGIKTVSTFCRICEPLCGVLATVEDGKITKISSNPDHVASQGHFCKKASKMVDVTYDPDRILHPMKRTGGPGEFTQISWQQAFDEICASLKKTQSNNGKESVAFYRGNPAMYSYATILVMDGFCEAMGIKWRYDADGEDGKAIQAALALMYGSVGVFNVPDLWHTDYALIIGANPLVSHGSSICEPRVAMALQGIRKRGGQIVVVDPRRTETAKGNTHVPIQAGTDAYLLSALIHEVIEKSWVDKGFVREHTSGYETLRQAVSSCTPEWAAPHTGIDAATIRQIAKDFASTKRASIHCRLGTSTQRFGTLSSMLIQCLMVVTGHLGSEGGNKFSAGIIDASKLAGSTMGQNPGPGSGLPDVGGSLPSVSMIKDIETPGAEQVKAMLMIAANPCLSSTGAGPKMDAAMEKLDLFVSLDFYMNETNRYADYILPAAGMFEREDVPFLGLIDMLRPSLFATEAVISKRGEAREDWEILNEICRRLGHGSTLPFKPLRMLAKLGVRLQPRHLMDLIIRTSTVGDKFGFKPGGLNLKKLLTEYPNGFVLHETLPDVDIAERLQTPDKKIHLGTAEFCSEMERLTNDRFYQNDDYPMRMIGLREKLTQNSWMHNVLSPANKSYKHAARIHPNDAQARGIQDGELVHIRSPYGELEVEAKLSDAMNPGNLALPHGWGHNGGWRQANARGGVNSNIIASDNPEDMDKISGIATLNGIPIQVSKVASQAEPQSKGHV